ncbi:MAG TPA: peptidylprolyl isomerase, partial [Thermoanaerobaculia bacterium]
AKDGGDAGWVVRGERDPKFEDAAFRVPVGVMSGIVGTDYGYYFILVEDKKAAGTVPFEEVRGNIRNAMLAQKQADVMAEVTRVTNELRAKGNVVVYTANLD